MECIRRWNDKSFWDGKFTIPCDGPYQEYPVKTNFDKVIWFNQHYTWYWLMGVVMLVVPIWFILLAFSLIRR